MMRDQLISARYCCEVQHSSAARFFRKVQLEVGTAKHFGQGDFSRLLSTILRVHRKEGLLLACISVSMISHFHGVKLWVLCGSRCGDDVAALELSNGVCTQPLAYIYHCIRTISWRFDPIEQR